MSWVHPFAGLLPDAKVLRDIIAPPYDVVDVAQARALAKDLPNNFLHITRSEIDLADDMSPDDISVYQLAAMKYQAMQQQGLLQRDNKIGFYIYELSSGTHRQVGIMAAVSLLAYQQGGVRKHELTRPNKEQDRARHIEALHAQVSPVLLCYKPDIILASLLAGITSHHSHLQAKTPDGILHRLWRMNDTATCNVIAARFGEMRRIYIADGHHRCAAALQVAMQHGDLQLPLAHNYCLAGLFPADELQILAYHRVVHSLAGMSDETFLMRLEEAFFIEPLASANLPKKPREFTLCLPTGVFRFRYRKDIYHADPSYELDVSILDTSVLKAIIGIQDSRHDERLDFVGGQNALATVDKGVSSGQWRAGFLLYPTAINQLIAIADKEQIMPLKSTWFEPKLADGLVCYPFIASNGAI